MGLTGLIELRGATVSMRDGGCWNSRGLIELRGPLYRFEIGATGGCWNSGGHWRHNYNGGYVAD